MFYYTRGVYNTFLFLLITTATKNDPTEQHDKNVQQILDCMETNPDKVVRFHASDMILRADTDASYLTEPEARSRAAGYFSWGSHLNKIKTRAF